MDDKIYRQRDPYASKISQSKCDISIWQQPTEVDRQSKYCDKLINADYNNFINRKICQELEYGNTKPLFKFIDNRRGNSNTIKHLDGCDSDSAKDIAEHFAKSFTTVFTEDDGKCAIPTAKTVKQQSNIKIESKGVLKQLQALDADRKSVV